MHVLKITHIFFVLVVAVHILSVPCRAVPPVPFHPLKRRFWYIKRDTSHQPIHPGTSSRLLPFRPFRSRFGEPWTYTCTFSLCKRCSKDAVILRVRGNKGFCEICKRTVMLIEIMNMERRRWNAVNKHFISYACTGQCRLDQRRSDLPSGAIQSPGVKGVVPSPTAVLPDIEPHSAVHCSSNFNPALPMPQQGILVGSVNSLYRRATISSEPHAVHMNRHPSAMVQSVQKVSSQSPLVGLQCQVGVVLQLKGHFPGTGGAQLDRKFQLKELQTKDGVHHKEPWCMGWRPRSQ